MAIMRWDPFGEMLSMQSDMDRLFRRFTGTGQGQQTTGWMPRIDVKQRGDDLIVQADLPGVKPQDVDVSVTDGVLTISGERSEEKKQEDENWVVRETSYGSFQRQMVLPEGLDPKTIHANFNNGVLEVEIPKALEQMKPKTTKVQIGQGEQQGQQAMTGGTQEVPVQQEGEGQTQQTEERQHAGVTP